MLILDLFIVFSTGTILLVLARQLFLSITYWGFPVDRIEIAGDENLPTVTVLIPAHNEDRVIDGCLTAMRKLDYPRDKLSVMVVNDRSKDRTGEIANRHAAEDSRIEVLHRADDAVPGKPAALADAIDLIESDVLVFFDADYVPPPELARQLVAPLARPHVGATMGRVVPDNTDSNLLTKLIDLERRAGYAVDQTMRDNFHLLPQFGGTCGAVHMDALEAVGGWKTDVLAEDTDLTYRLFIAGYTVAYIPTALCHEESPETWQVRFRQVRRWSYGHNDCLFRYFLPTLLTPKQPLAARIDAAIVLLLFLVPALAILSLVLLILSPIFGEARGLMLVLPPIIVGFCAIGNFAPYFQMATACISDGQPAALRALPLIAMSSFVSLAASVGGLLQLIRDRTLGLAPKWDKTLRFRGDPAVPPQVHAG